MRQWLLLLSALVWAIPLAARAVPAVELHPSIGRPSRVTISGRLLRSDPERTPHPPIQRNLRRLTAKSLEHLPVKVELLGLARETVSGDDGMFEVVLTAPADLPFPVGRHEARASAKGVTSVSSVEILADQAPFILISDFDDTIAISNIQRTRSMLRSALLEDASTQPVVPGMAEFYQCLRSSAEPPPGFAVVTGSPLSFGRRLESFLAQHQFPFTALYLRKLGPKTLSHFKEPVLRRLLREFPEPFVLVGDSGEEDPEVYALIRREFPGRVSAIFIRDVGRTADPKRFQNMILFRTAGEAARAAAARGLLSPACLEATFPPGSN